MSRSHLLGYGCGLLVLVTLTTANVPVLHLYNGHITVDQPVPYTPIQHLVAGQAYTFEIQMSNVQQQDYIVETCTMNGKPFIDGYGCVLCGDGILTSIETEQYARVGAVKRTLVHFIAKQEFVNIACNIRVLNCCGCAERSCERHPVLAMFPSVIHTLAYPVVIPVKHSYFPLWLLILLLVLLLLCLLALCLIPFLLWRRRRKTVTTVAAHEKCGVGVETEKAELKDAAIGCKNVHTYSVDGESIHHVRPVVAIGERETTVREAEIIARDERIYRAEPSTEVCRVYHDSGRDEYRSDREGYRSSSRGVSRGTDVHGAECDRASYRNFAYERDMGRVVPLEGFDQVETSERRHRVCPDEDYDVVERDLKRTHTSRFVQETRHCEEDDASSVGERFREEDVHHAYYSHSLPV